jgi:hypothetical protein
MSDEEQQLNPADAVVLAYVNGNEVSYSWHHSMIELIGWDLAHKGRVLQGGYVAMRYGTDGLVEARNKAVRQFLDERLADWLFWIDTDMGFPSDVIDRLLEVADPKSAPIVGGLCFTQRETGPDGLGGWHTRATPTIFDWLHIDEQQGFAVRWDYPMDSVVRCAGTGSACVLIHRSVFERMEKRFGPKWYDRIPNQSMGQLTSEDLSFCMRAGALNIPVHVHTGVKISHHKPVWLSENEYQVQSAPPPATEQVAVIVPVMKRPGNAEPFMRSLRASTGLATAYAMVDFDDAETIKAWADAGAVIVQATDFGASPGTFAEKVNAGHRETKEPWLFIVGDDVRFHPGWYDRAVRASAGQRYPVVGTNDITNPRVMSGEHGTHLLIRREYVDGMGASWDGPGVVCHEGYRHWYVDDEIVTAAKQRGLFAMAHDSVVEHMHPMWGKGEPDEVYELGQSHAAGDRKVFEARCRTYL